MNSKLVVDLCSSKLNEFSSRQISQKIKKKSDNSTRRPQGKEGKENKKETGGRNIFHSSFHKCPSFIFHDLESGRIGVQGYRQYTVIWLNILSPEEKKMTTRVPPPLPRILGHDRTCHVDRGNRSSRRGNRSDVNDLCRK